MSDDENDRPAEGPDDTFARLQAADPAADAAVDVTALRREVDHRLADAPVTAASARRAPRWLQVAAVAATVALVGSAAFVVGRQTGSGTDPTVAAVAENAVTDTASSAASAGVVDRVPATAGGPMVQGSPVPEGADAKAAAGSLVGWGGGRTHFNDGGLAVEGGTAQAWGYDPSGIASAATAERIAAAMGIEGSAVVQYQAWTVGPLDGTGPTVSVMGDGTASVSYYDPQASPSCDQLSAPAEGPAAGGDVAASCTLPVLADISADDAVARSTELLARIGLDPAAFTVSAPEDQAGSGFRTVQAVPILDDVAPNVPPGGFGQQWSFSFAGDRLSGFYGALAPLVDLGGYPVIGPAEAVTRMNDPRYGASPGAMPVDIMTVARTEPAAPDPNTVPTPVAPTPGAAIAWPVTEITLTAASLGLTSQYGDNGSVLLLPAYTMTDDSGSAWTVVAVADDRLDFTG